MREKLIELLDKAKSSYEDYLAEKDRKMRMAKTEADFEAEASTIEIRHSFYAGELIANGVTIVTDNNVGDKLTPTDKDICVLTNGVTVQEWIPVSERLPFAEYGESDDVLAITELGVMRTLYFNGGNWCFQNGECCPHKVTHWMPLPEPPKED